MDNILRNCTLAAAFVVAMFCFSAYYTQRETERIYKPQIKTEVIEDAQAPEVHKEKLVKVIPPPPPAPVVTPKPIIVKPVIYYTSDRVTEFTDVGVRAIQKGVKVEVVKNDDGSVTVTDGKQTIKTKASNITSDPIEISKLITTSKKRP